MKRLLMVCSVTLSLSFGTAVSFHAQESRINGCYLKKNGQLRIASKQGACLTSELAVSWNLARRAGTSSGRHKASRIRALPTLGGTNNFAYAINDWGLIVGQSNVPDGASHAFIFGLGRVRDIAPLNSGSIQTIGPTGINNAGQVASGVMVGGEYVPAVYDSLTRRITTLGSLGGVTSFGLVGAATSINGRGESVGYAYIDGLTRHAFLHSGGVMTDLGSFGGYSAATDINDAGMVVGFASNTPFGSAHAFLYSGTLIDINPFGGLDFSTSESAAHGINERGDVVGEGLIRDGTAFHAFLYRNGAVRDLGTLPGGRNSYGQAINKARRVVGTADIPFVDICVDPDTGETFECTNFKLTPFLYSGGDMIDLNRLLPADSGWELVWASDINDEDQIVGYGLLDGAFRAFRLDITR